MPSPTTAGHLSHHANFYRHKGDNRGSRGMPLGTIDPDSSDEGVVLGAILPSTRLKAHPDLQEPPIRPPEFLTPLEAMKDIYMRIKGRASRRTLDLLTSSDLDDLLDTLANLFETEALVKSPDARVRATVTKPLGSTPLGPEHGPLLAGLHDPRLTEPWRLFLEAWDIWHPDREDEGVELFIEGDVESEDGTLVEIMQSLDYFEGEVTLTTQVDSLKDVLTFDGSCFYRLRQR